MLIRVLLYIIGILLYEFVKNRFIGECSRIVSDVFNLFILIYLMDLPKQKKLIACLLAIDMEKKLLIQLNGIF